MGNVRQLMGFGGNLFEEDAMTVEQLSEILSVLPPDNEVMIEYQPRAHEWITEAVLGVRTNDSNTIILGVTEVI